MVKKNKGLVWVGDSKAGDINIQTDTSGACFVLVFNLITKVYRYGYMPENAIQKQHGFYGHPYETLLCLNASKVGLCKGRDATFQFFRPFQFSEMSVFLLFPTFLLSIIWGYVSSFPHKQCWFPFKCGPHKGGGGRVICIPIIIRNCSQYQSIQVVVTGYHLEKGSNHVNIMFTICRTLCMLIYFTILATNVLESWSDEFKQPV